MHKPADRVLFYLFTALLFWLPLPFGSNRPWAVALFAVVTCILLGWWLALFLREKTTLTTCFRRSLPLVALIGITQLWLCLQGPYYSQDPSRTLHQLIQGVALFNTLVLTLLLTRSKRRIRIIVYTLVVSGVVQAVYGSLMTLSGIEYVLFFPKEAYSGVATGTFINRNHLAGYLELTLAVGIGVMIATLKDNGQSSWRDFSRRLLTALLGTKARVRIGLIIMVAALVMTHSRMGNTAFFASLTLTGIIALLLGKRASKATLVLLGSLIIIDLVVVGTFFGVERVIDRLENTSLETVRRDEVNNLAMGALQDHYVTGTGAGSFYGIFPSYRDESVGKIYFDHAHNDYMQFALEFGLIGFLPLLAAVIWTFMIALRAQWIRRDKLMRGLSFSAMMAIIALGIHSTVDFNLQIPANAATFTVILALGWMSLYFREAKST